MEEYFVSVRIDLPAPRDPRGERYGDAAADFYEAVSEVLGAGEFESPMTLSEDRVHTYVYMPADSSDMAATNAERLLSEAAERTWGPGATVAAERVVTAAERDRELASEGIE